MLQVYSFLAPAAYSPPHIAHAGFRAVAEPLSVQKDQFGKDLLFQSLLEQTRFKECSVSGPAEMDKNSSSKHAGMGWVETAFSAGMCVSRNTSVLRPSRDGKGLEGLCLVGWFDSLCKLKWKRK